jgi:hypothetical protein
MCGACDAWMLAVLSLAAMVRASAAEQTVNAAEMRAR